MSQEALFETEFEAPESKRGSINSGFRVGQSSRSGSWIRSGPKIILFGVYSRSAHPHRASNRLEQEFESEVSFGDAFRKCMQSLGMPAPTSLFTSAAQVQGTISTLMAAVQKFGTSVTIAELVGAGVLSEVFLALGALTAAAYAGACIGCLANALGQKLSGGLTLADAWSYLRSEL